MLHDVHDILHIKRKCKLFFSSESSVVEYGVFALVYVIQVLFHCQNQTLMVLPDYDGCSKRHQFRTDWLGICTA